MDVNGACHCGDIAFEARIDPRWVGICHCTDCQIFSGSAFRTSVLVPGDEFRLTRGTPANYEKTAQSGALRNLAFCKRCGTHLYGMSTGPGGSRYSVRVGVLAQRAEIAPAVQVWCQSELSWLPELQELRRVEQQ